MSTRQLAYLRLNNTDDTVNLVISVSNQERVMHVLGKCTEWVEGSDNDGRNGKRLQCQELGCLSLRLMNGRTGFHDKNGGA